MDIFRQDLRGQGKSRTPRNAFPYQGASRAMFGMLQQFRGYQKTAVDAVRHILPSSISPNKSSSGEKGRKMTPTLATGISKMLCRVSGNTSCRRATMSRSNSANSSAFSFGIAASISVNVLIRRMMSEKTAPHRTLMDFASRESALCVRCGAIFGTLEF